MAAAEEEAYERGRTEGEVRERLASHDRHFEAINGQLAVVATALAQMTTAITRVGDRQQAIIDTATATREAVRAAADRRWSVWQKIFATVGAVAAVAAIVGLYLAWRTTH